MPRSCAGAAPLSRPQYVADVAALEVAEVTGINFALQETPELLGRLADALVTGRIVAPPISRISLDEAPAALDDGARREGKTVIAL
jgi:hypothetical protein